MIEFWKNKEQNYIEEVNKKRSESLRKQCIWLKKEGGKPFPCNIELILTKLSKGYLIVDTKKNREKVYNFFGEVPNFFWAEKNKQKQNNN